MTVYVTYGSSSHTPHDLARVVTDRLNVAFEERDSDFRGVYFKGETGGCEIEIQPNAIPGDHGYDDLYDLEYPSVPTLLLVAVEIPNATIDARLNTIDGLNKLGEVIV